MKRYSLLTMESVQKTRELMDVVLGKAKADMAVVNGTILNVYTGEWIGDQVVLTKGEWIAYVGPPLPAAMGPGTKVVDADGKAVIPGLIDGHTHLSDCLYSPGEFLRKAMVGGTTTIITEVIEPFFIRGTDGIVEFLDAFKDQPVKVFGTVPPLPSTSRRHHGMPMEALEALLARSDVLGLGEAYWQAVLQDPDLFLPLFRKTNLSGRRIEGHSAGAKGRTLSAYAISGVSSCHESLTTADVMERLRLGLHVMIREGSIRSDLRAVTDLCDTGIDYHRLILVTDGVRPLDLREKGYMEHVVQKTVDEGLDPVTAVRMATINVADYFGLDGIVGSIAPGRQADLLILPEKSRIAPETVISRGRIIAANGRILVPPRDHAFPSAALDTVLLPRPSAPEDFAIPVPDGRTEVQVRVIDQVTELVTREAVLPVHAEGGVIHSDPGRDLLKVAAVERRFGDGKVFVGLVRGFGLRTGAIGCSVAWDTSDIVVIGENDRDMAKVVNRIRELRGGLVLCAGGSVVSEIPLPVFGLMSELPLDDLAGRIRGLSQKAGSLGFSFEDPHKTLVPLTGAAIPFIRLSEEGLFDIRRGERVPFFVD
jgi:adenine deaminase